LILLSTLYKIRKHLNHKYHTEPSLSLSIKDTKTINNLDGRTEERLYTVVCHALTNSAGIGIITNFIRSVDGNQTNEGEGELMTLTKADIVESVSNQIGYSKNQSKEIVETLLELVKASLDSGDDVLISGFGKFRVKEKTERRGRNPHTGDDLMLEPRKVVTFRCSGILRDKINGPG
jgi:integration host factor subunit alpha